jgi:hypothetical protein
MDARTRIIGAVIGGAAALVIGTQVAGAQESPTPSPPRTESPAPDGSQSPDSDRDNRRDRGSREDCPDKNKDGVPDDAPSTEGSATDATSV